MTKAVAPIQPGGLDAWSMVEDFSDIKRLLAGVEPAPQIQGDRFRAAPQASKANQRQAIPAVHTAFDVLTSGARLAASAVRAAGDALGQPSDPGLALLQSKAAMLNGETPAGPSPDAVQPARKYAGGLKEFQGAQLYTLSRYQTDAPALGIVFAKRPDGSRVYFVKESGDDKPMTQAQLDRWLQQRIQASLAETGQARKAAADADFGNQSFQAEIAQSVLGQKKGQTSLEDLLKAAGGLQRLSVASQMDAATRDVGKQTQIVQGKLAQEAAAQPAPTGPAEGTPPTTNENQAPQPPPAAPADKNSPAPAPGRSREAEPSPFVPATQHQLRELLRQIDEDDARQRALEELRDVAAARSQRASSERGAQNLADTLGNYQRHVQKQIQFEKGEEMLQLLRISHASRRYEGRFSSLAEKTFLTLIHSSLVRVPGDEDRQA